jgi:sulfonate transport system substrate-binding protein
VEIPGIKASSKGAKLYVAAKLNNGPTYNAIVTRKDVNKAEDLKGKKVAIVQKSASEYYFNKYLEVFKISPNDMNMMHLAPPEMIPAFMRDMIDAFAVWEPWPTRALEADPRAKILARASDQNLYDNPIFFYVSGDLAAKPDVLVRALRSLVLAENYIQTNPPAVAKIVAEAYKIPEPLAAQLLGKIVFRVELRKDTINKYKDIAEWMKDKKLIDNLPDFDKLFKTEFIKATAPDRTDL